MKPAASHARRSLRWKILRPLALASAVVAVLIVWWLQQRARQQLGEDLAHRAELVANMIGYSAESISRAGELQRIVSAVGADRDILDIVVAAGEPARIIGCTQTRWLNGPLEAPLEAGLLSEVHQAVRDRQALSHFNDREHTFIFISPLQLTHQALTSGAPISGVVLIKLDARALAAEVRHSTLILSGVFLIGLLAFFVAAYLLLERRVLRPVELINRRVEGGGGLAEPADRAIDHHDEIGRLATTLRDFQERTAVAIRDLANQKFALDQHAIVSIADIDGRIIYANDRLCAISGYERGELLGQSNRIFKSGRHTDDFYKSMWEVLSAGRTWHGELCNRNKSGGLYWVSSSIVPLLDAEGKPGGYIGIHTDITERKQIEEQLQSAKEAADAANKAKSDFLATMSHEIRTPLNGVIGFTELLLGTNLAVEQRQHVELLRTSGENLLVLINDILDLSKIEAGKLVLEKAAVDFHGCVREAVALLADQASKKRLRISAEIASDAPQWLVGDPVRLRQVLLNLIGNAIKFTSAGGVKVTVTAGPSFMQVAVTDTGVGMSREQLARIFHKFSQADTSTTRRYGGTGLGLVICKNLVEAMGGEISVQSSEGHGSTFRFTIPIIVPEVIPEIPGEPESGDPQSDDAGQPGDGGVVLVVDDSEVNLVVAKSMLWAIGYRAETAINGQLAVQMTARRAYDAILMDYHMPVLDGVDATREIRAVDGPNRACPIIGVSASLDDRETCLNAGMDEFLPKPFRKLELKQLLEALVRQRE